MQPERIRLRAAMLALALGAAPAAHAAAPDVIGPAEATAEPAVFENVLEQHELDREMTVKNWVLCASQGFAETLVKARESGRDEAARIYAELSEAHSCGRFAEMRVILDQSLYVSSPEPGHETKIFNARINFSGAWARGYLVYGGLPDE